MAISSLNINIFLSNTAHLKNRFRNRQDEREQFQQNLNEF